MNASFAGIDPPSATIGRRRISAVSMLSLRMTGTPNNGFLCRPPSVFVPVTPVVIEIVDPQGAERGVACSFTCMKLFSCGPA